MSVSEPADVDEIVVGRTKTDHTTTRFGRRTLLGAAGVAFVAACEAPVQESTSPTTTKPPRSTTTVKPAKTTTSTTSTSTTTSTTSTSTTSTSTSTSTSTTSTTAPPAPGTAPSVELLIDKLTWGPTPGLAAQIETRGVWGWIDDQLDPDGLPNAEAMVSGYETLTNSNLANRAVSEMAGDHVNEQLDHATILRNRYSEAQLLELMVDFWNNHLNAWRNHNWMDFLNNNYHETVIRPHALGSFEDMLVASAHSAAMLNYLDNWLSYGNGDGGPNENYARELMELHTLGIVDGEQVYTEADVGGAAKLLSGWTLQWGNTETTKYVFGFEPWMHNRGAVSVLDGGFTRPERSYGQGYDDGVAFVRFLANHPSTAKHIASKLCKRFVSDRPSIELVATTAAVFTASETQIAPTLRHIFESVEFRNSHRSKVRRPLDTFMATLRATGIELGNDSNTELGEVLLGTLAAMGQPLNERPSPDGYPDHAGYWVSSEGLLQRWKMAGHITRDLGMEGISIDNEGLLPSPLPATCSGLVAWLSFNVFNVEITNQKASELCESVGLVPTGAASVVADHGPVLSHVLSLLMCQPEFQRR